ncbi:MAG: vWA domain-containing protein [Chloroflexota bacterium]
MSGALPTLDSGRVALIHAWSDALRKGLAEGLAVRVGETTVLSRQVHLQRPDAPGEVQVSTSDAGRVFYQRSQPGEILHSDTFHAIAVVDQHQVAQALASAADAWFGGGARVWRGAGRPTDYIDIQTGAGGGRVSGALAYGRKPALRRSHMNHVHLACGLPDEYLPLFVWLVCAAEQAIVRQGVEIRRLERIVPAQPGRGRSDLSDYADITDSLLRGTGAGSAAGPAAGDIDPADVAALVALADEFGGVDEAREALAACCRGQAADSRQLTGRLLSSLIERGLLETDQKYNMVLSPEGERLHRALTDHQREVELEFRRLIRRVPLPLRHGAGGRGSGCRTVERTGPVLRVRPVDRGEWPTDIAPAETIARAWTRSALAGDATSRVEASDICIRERGRPRRLDLCLLIDASASMAGRRIKAARYLTEHILLATRDRVAVVTFQEHQVDVRVPFTRSFDRAAAGLRQIRPQGLTPLAQGLLAALSYLDESRARNPMVLLVTDGIPTVPEWTLNPIADACRAAEAVARSRVQFACIGLEPNRDFLEQLTRAAHGRLHVVSELDRDRMVEIVHRERGL